MAICPNCGQENPVGFRFCGACGAPLGSDSAGPTDERKLTTIMFADVSGSTALGERLDPERLRLLLGRFFHEMAAVISSWGGTVEKYIGDAIMAVFGVPAVREDDAERAIRAALDMLERLEEVNRDFSARHGIALAIRIGVNTGEVISPLGGTAKEQLVAGDAVNVAARLEQAAKPGAVLVGERTYLATRRMFSFDEPVALELKGKADLVPAHRVRGALPITREQWIGLRAPLVGRWRERDRLVGLLAEAAEARTPRLVLVYGPAGIGKSRLSREFLEAAQERHRDPLVLKGRCLAAGHGITYWALGEILREACGISLDDRADVAGLRLQERTRGILGSLELPEEEVERTVSALATTAGIPLPDNPLDRLEPRLVAKELAGAWPRFATALAARHLTVFLVEDLHWAGEPLLEMLDRLLVRSSGPLFLLATARPELAQAHPGFAAGRDGASSVSLAPLNDTDAAGLLEGLLGTAELPEELRSEIVGTAEGNPFFLEEIVQRLVDAGGIVREDGRWRATSEATGVPLPDTIRALLAARIDALLPDEKRVLQEAAVIGRTFWEAALGSSVGDALGPLEGLEDRGLIAARPTSSLGGQTEYEFKHALVRDVAYAGLPKARRARAHYQHAAWLEELAGDRRDELAELIAAHYRSALIGEEADLAWADDPQTWATMRVRGIDALLAAGEVARRRFAIAKALELHEQALALAGDDLERGRALAAIGDDHDAAYHGDEAFEAYRRALALMRTKPDTEPARARICLMAARLAGVKWGGFRSKPTPAAMEAFVEEGLRVAKDNEIRGWLTVLKGHAGYRWLSSELQDPLPLSERIRFAEGGVQRAERLDLPDLLSQAYRTYGLLQSAAGRWDVTCEIARRDLQLAERLNPTGEAFALFWNALFLMEIAGEYDANLPHAEASLDAGRQLSPHEAMHGTYTVMNACYHLGRWTQLEAHVAEHLEALAKEPGIVCPYVRGGPLIAATALAHRGKLDRAEELAATLTPKLDNPGVPEAFLARYLVARGDPAAGQKVAEQILGRSVQAEENAFEVVAMLEALVALEDWDGLEAFLPRARAFAPALALIGPMCDRAEGIIRAIGSDDGSAEELLRKALVEFTRLGAAFEAALTTERLVPLAVAGDEATRLRSDALSVYEQLEAAPHVARLQAAASTR